MNKINELIAEFCPDGVEYKSIAELFNTKNGYTPSKSHSEYWENGTISYGRYSRKWSYSFKSNTVCF